MAAIAAMAAAAKAAVIRPASARPAVVEGRSAVTAVALAPAYVAWVTARAATARASTSPAMTSRITSPGCRYRAGARIRRWRPGATGRPVITGPVMAGPRAGRLGVVSPGVFRA